MTTLTAVNAIWEQWDLVCDPNGCEPLDRVLRLGVYSFLVIALMIFYAAVRPWTRSLPTAAGVVVAALSSLVIVWLARGIVASSGSLRTAAVITALGLVAVLIGRPDFTERSSRRAASLADGEASVNEDASPTSSTH